jgi:hypothetical protein
MDKCNIKVLIEHIDFDISTEKKKYTLGNAIDLTADIELNHIKIKT